LSPWLAAREPGDVVRITGPDGDVYYRGEDRIVVLAAGPGIGPAVAIGERARMEGAAVAIVHPADNTVHRERLRSLDEAGATVYPAEDGLEAVTNDAINSIGGSVFVYGFSPFVQEAIRAIESAGYDSEDVKVESFGPGP
ncbi:MAG: oxidoreductase, partial [archaeon]